MLKNLQINREHYFYGDLDFRNVIKINSDYEIELIMKLSHNYFFVFLLDGTKEELLIIGKWKNGQ